MYLRQHVQFSRTHLCEISSFCYVLKVVQNINVIKVVMFSKISCRNTKNLKPDHESLSIKVSRGRALSNSFDTFVVDVP